MLWAIVTVAVVAVVFGPSLWVRWIMTRYAQEIPGMPGTGGELAQHLIKRFELTDVSLETTPAGDHYDPAEKTVRLSPRVMDGKSLTAVAIATHEVGHAIQHHQQDPRLATRTRLLPLADRIARVSAFAVSAAPLTGVLTRHPVPFGLLLAFGLAGFAARMLVHAVTLPVEWDASFGKALPILEQGQYVAPAEHPAVAKILRAAAYTYVAAALADILNLGRWITLLLRR